MPLFYDLHIHSALSPCGDNEMTPNNIVNMAMLAGLHVIALTDHNSCKNCPAIVKAAEHTPLQVLCGMEINTEEEAHAICLFPTLVQAMEFDGYVYTHLPNIANDPLIFGEQRILDELDRQVGTEERLLINATTISIMELHTLVRGYGGVCFPAHIDKGSYSITASLGMIPPECGFTTYEVKDPSKLPQLRPLMPNPDTALIVSNSDAHYLWDIAEPIHTLPCAPSAQALFSYLFDRG